MKLASPLLIARRFLTSPGSSLFHRVRGSILGIGLSLVPLIVVIHVAGGMVEGITRRFIEAGTYHIQVAPRGAVAESKLADLAEDIRRLDGVWFSRVERRGLALLSSPGARTGASVRAVDPHLWSDDPLFRSYVSVKAGRFALEGADDIVLGEEIADELSVGIGDEVRALTFRALPGGGYLPRVSRFVVTGIVSTGYQDLDRLWAFISLERGIRILGPEASEDIIGVKIDHPFGIPNALFGGTGFLSASGGVEGEARRQATRTLSEIRDLAAGDFWVRTWFDVERSRYMSFRTTKNLLAFIMMLIVVVATVNISSTLVMMVLEKRQEIAILKSVGGSPSDLQLVFVLGGFLTGAAGALLGMLLGLAVTVNVNEILLLLENLANAVLKLASSVGGQASVPLEIFNADFYLESIPIRLELRDLLVVAGATMALSTLASLLPARRAARIRPTAVLQKH